MVDRINLILQAKNITSRQFADEIGIQPSGMSHILGGRNKPSLDFAMKVLRRYPEIDANWLLLGQGEMYATAQAANGVPMAQLSAPSNASATPSSATTDEPTPLSEATADAPSPTSATLPQSTQPTRQPTLFGFDPVPTDSDTPTKEEPPALAPESEPTTPAAYSTPTPLHQPPTPIAEPSARPTEAAQHPSPLADHTLPTAEPPLSHPTAAQPTQVQSKVDIPRVQRVLLLYSDGTYQELHP